MRSCWFKADSVVFFMNLLSQGVWSTLRMIARAFPPDLFRFDRRFPLRSGR